MIGLDARLRKIVDYIDGDTLADIGCDHGKVVAAALEENRVACAIACDVSAPSLDKARALAAQRGLDCRVAFRCTDGFAGFGDDDADIAVVAGMGGAETIKILKGLPRGVKRLVLSPHANACDVRGSLKDFGFGIEAETTVWCADKFYPVIRARRGLQRALSRSDLLFGLSQKDNGDYLRYLAYMRDKYDTLARKVARADHRQSQKYDAIARCAESRLKELAI